MSIYESEALSHLEKEFSNTSVVFFEMQRAYSDLTFAKAETKEFLFHGFLRRLGTLKRCLENIWKISPPENSTPLNDSDRSDLCINLQCFVFNVFGCVDNLALAWATETGFAYSRKSEIDFYNEKLKAQLCPKTQQTLDRMKDWYDTYLKNYRHALGHRIPLYVAPLSISSKDRARYNSLQDKRRMAMTRLDLKELDEIAAEEMKIGKFLPMMMHSFGEKSSPVYFHGQFLTDWITIAALAQEMANEFRELGKLSTNA